MNAPARVLFLIGLRGTGKSSVGRRLAQLAGAACVDLDDFLVRAVLNSEPEWLAASGLRAEELRKFGAGRILAEVGEERFRECEVEVLSALDRLASGSANSPKPDGGSCKDLAFSCDREWQRTAFHQGGGDWVVCTGGGVIERPENRRRLAALGVCVWLTAAPELLADRLQADTADVNWRPALTDAGRAGQLRVEIEQMAARRNGLYAQLADLKLDVSKQTPEQVARQLLSAWPSK